jgi:predicted dehydrogenase
LAGSDPQAMMPVDPRDAVHVLAVIDAARTSARGGRVVEVVTPGQTP